MQSRQSVRTNSRNFVTGMVPLQHFTITHKNKQRMITWTHSHIQSLTCVLSQTSIFHSWVFWKENTAIDQRPIWRANYYITIQCRQEQTICAATNMIWGLSVQFNFNFQKTGNNLKRNILKKQQIKPICW